MKEELRSDVDYSELEGKEIKWAYTAEEVVDAIVVNVDYDVGITIVRKDDKTRNLTCLNGKSSPNPYVGDVYDDFFDTTVKMIREGYYDSEITNKIYDDFIGDPVSFRMAECAYK